LIRSNVMAPSSDAFEHRPPVNVPPPCDRDAPLDA
jgi:hypothetical protein